MSNKFLCPYCGQPKHKDSAAEFCSCRFCGFKSALTNGGDGAVLVVDRRMPFLQRRCQELSEQYPDATVIVDRRIAQDPYDERERRLSQPETVNLDGLRP